MEASIWHVFSCKYCSNNDHVIAIFIAQIYIKYSGEYVKIDACAATAYAHTHTNSHKLIIYKPGFLEVINGPVKEV